MVDVSAFEDRRSMWNYAAILAQNIDTIYKLYANYAEGLHFSAFIKIFLMLVWGTYNYIYRYLASFPSSCIVYIYIIMILWLYRFITD